MEIVRKLNTYESNLSTIYAGQASTIHEKAAFSYISDFPVQLSDFLLLTHWSDIKTNFSKTNVGDFFDLIGGFQTFPAGYMHIFSRGIRIRGPKSSNPVEKPHNLDFKFSNKHKNDQGVIQLSELLQFNSWFVLCCKPSVSRDNRIARIPWALLRDLRQDQINTLH